MTRAGVKWSPGEDIALMQMIEDGLKHREIALQLGRSKSAVQLRMYTLRSRSSER